MTIFADTSALVSLFDQADSNHKKALELSEELSGHIFIITRYIFAEVVTVLSQKIGKEDAIYAGEYLKKKYTWIDVDLKVEGLAWEVFKTQKSKNVGFIDCIIIAMFRKRLFDKCFTFDSDFRKNDVDVID